MTDLDRETTRRLEKIAERMHQNVRDGEMYLWYQMDSAAVRRGDYRRWSFPVVGLPVCWHKDCAARHLPAPEWPDDCMCTVMSRGSSRRWQADCPAHGRDSSWSWARDVKERE